MKVPVFILASVRLKGLMLDESQRCGALGEWWQCGSIQEVCDDAKCASCSVILGEFSECAR